MEHITKPTRDPDLIVLINEQHLVLLHAHGELTELTRVPRVLIEKADAPETFLKRLVMGQAKKGPVNRVVLAVEADAPHELMVAPVFDTLADWAQEQGLDLLFLPAVTELNRALFPRGSSKQPAV